MGRMTKAMRQEKMAEAVELYAKGKNYSEIADGLGVSWPTAKNLVEDELANRSEHRGPEREASIARNLAVIRSAWEAYESAPATSLNKGGYLNTIVRAGERIDKLTGAEAPIKVQDTTEDYEIVWGEDADDAA